MDDRRNLISDKLIVEKVLSGNTKAFAIIVKDTERLVAQIVRKMVANEEVMYQKDGQPKHKLIAISANTFVFENLNDLKIEMTVESNRVTGFKSIFINGDTKFDKRD